MGLENQFITDLQGMNQRQDPDKIPDNASPLLLNISLARPGTWSKRPGSTILSNISRAGTGIQGMIDYLNLASVHSLRDINTGGLEIYNGTSYSTSFSGLSGTDMIQSAIYLNRHYFVGPNTYLQYETGTGTSTIVGSPSNQIQARCITIMGPTMYIGGVTGNMDRVYYSVFDNVNNVQTDQLYEISPAQTLATSTRFFSVITACTALFSYGSTGKIYAFTENECYQWDISYANNQSGPIKILDIGCCGPRAVTSCNGWMIWMDQNAKIWAWGGAGPAMPLSWDIEDDANGEAIINKIDKTQLILVAAGSLKNEFVFSVGNVTTFGEVINNAVIKGLISQNFNSVSWSVDSYPVRPAIFSKVRLNNTPVLVFGSSSTNDIYQMYTNNYDDGGVLINARAKTKFLDFGSAFKTRNLNKWYFKFRPQIKQGTYLRVRYSFNCNITYTIASDPVGLTPVNQYYVIDMYDLNASTLEDNIKMLNATTDNRFRTLSTEVGNGQLGEGFQVSGIGFLFETSELDVRGENQ